MALTGGRGLRVVVDGSFLGTGRGGDETFLTGLLGGLAVVAGPADSFPLLLPDGVDPPHAASDPSRFPVLRVPTRGGVAHFAATLPRALHRAGPADLVVTVTHAPVRSPVPRVLIVGDLSFVHRPRDYPCTTALRLNALVPLQVRQARSVLVPSEFTRADLVQTYRVAGSKVQVVPNHVLASPAGGPDAATWIRAAGVRPPYLLYLGNLHPRKNVARLVRAFRAAQDAHPGLARHQLVIAGARWWGQGDEEHAAAGAPQIRFLGRVSDAVRGELMARAEALAYVSLFEGFGLPPLEAMALGTPVLASSTTSLPWVCGTAALLVDPGYDTTVAAGVVRVLTDDLLRERLRRDGPRRAAAFHAARTGAAALAAFRRALALPVADEQVSADVSDRDDRHPPARLQTTRRSTW